MSQLVAPNRSLESQLNLSQHLSVSLFFCSSYKQCDWHLNASFRRVILSLSVAPARPVRPTRPGRPTRKRDRERKSYLSLLSSENKHWPKRDTFLDKSRDLYRKQHQRQTRHTDRQLGRRMRDKHKKKAL